MEIYYTDTNGWRCIETTQHIAQTINLFKSVPTLKDLQEEMNRLNDDCVAIYKVALENSKKPGNTKNAIKEWNKFLKLFFKTFEKSLRYNGLQLPLEQYEDGITREPPSFGGVYLIGSTHFNPITHEEFYWVKNGKANNMAKRMRQYDTHSPMTYQIAFKSCATEREAFIVESRYQDILKRIAINSCSNNSEWFRVSREVYLNICADGFNYLDAISKSSLL